MATESAGTRSALVVRIGTYTAAVAGAVWSFTGDSFSLAQRAGLLVASLAAAGLATIYKAALLRHAGRLGHLVETHRGLSAAALVVLLIGSVGVVAVSRAGGGAKPAVAVKKITWTTSYYADDCSTFVLPKPLTQFGPAPRREQLGDWARAHGAATGEPFGPQTGGTERVMLTLQGTSSRPVTLTELTFEAVQRKAAIQGPAVSNQCGDETIARYAKIDLDRRPPAIIESSATKTDVGGDRAVPIKFPYVVSATDPETLLLIASTHHFVAWRARLAWSDGETSGVAVLDDHGKPFMTTDPTAATSTHAPDDAGGWL